MVKKNNDKEEIVIKKSTIITVAIVLIVIFILILSWGKIDNLIKSKTIKDNNIIAEVNGEKITLDELDKAYDFFFFITGYPEEFKQFLTKEAFLDQLIAEKLLLQEVKKQGIELSDSEFNKLKEAAFGGNNLSETELANLLEGNNITYDYFIGYYKKQVLIAKLLNKTIVDDIKVDAEEIENYYENNKADFMNQSLKEVNESIKTLLISVKQRDILKNYIDRLKTNADIRVYFNEQKTTGATVKKVSNECIKKYGIDVQTVIFYHANWCPHCRNMVPIVKELENEGFSFAWIEVEDQRAMAIINDCFNDVVGKGVPEFICAGTKEVKLGEQSKNALKEFAEKCTS